MYLSGTTGATMVGSVPLEYDHWPNGEGRANATCHKSTASLPPFPLTSSTCRLILNKMLQADPVFTLRKSTYRIVNDDFCVLQDKKWRSRIPADELFRLLVSDRMCTLGSAPPPPPSISNGSEIQEVNIGFDTSPETDEVVIESAVLKERRLPKPDILAQFSHYGLQQRNLGRKHRDELVDILLSVLITYDRGRKMKVPQEIRDHEMDMRNNKVSIDTKSGTTTVFLRKSARKMGKNAEEVKLTDRTLEGIRRRVEADIKARDFNSAGMDILDKLNSRRLLEFPSHSFGKASTMISQSPKVTFRVHGLRCTPRVLPLMDSGLSLTLLISTE